VLEDSDEVALVISMVGSFVLSAQTDAVS
jgi:hypothetical protein